MTFTYYELNVDETIPLNNQDRTNVVRTVGV